MQKINIINGIPVIDVTLQYQGNIINIPNVVLDSGAERSVFDSDYILESYPDLDLDAYCF